MNKLMVRCDRCGGHGIYFVRVENGRGIPAQPDHGICYKCNGTKVTEANIPRVLRNRILRFMNRHNLNRVLGIVEYIHYALVYTDRYVIKFNVDGGVAIKLR